MIGVPDTNVIVYFLLPRLNPELGALAGRLFGELNLMALPTLWRHEFLNTLATYFRAGHIDLADAELAWAKGLGNFQDAERPFQSLRALEFAKEKNVSGYDAQFLALADELGGRLITEDKALRKAAPEYCLSMREWLEKKG